MRTGPSGRRCAPAGTTAFLEDVADLLGLFIAFGGVFLGHVLHNVYADGVASVLIGLLLMAVAGALARQSKRLLLGQGTKPAAIRHLAALTGADPAVVRARHIATMYLGSEEVTLIQSVVFRADLSQPGHRPHPDCPQSRLPRHQARL